jgi:hypothetical protein
MATTTFKVTNLNPDFEFIDGFWFKVGSDGGVNTQGTTDPSDDTITPSAGTYADDRRGDWIWCNGTEFTLDGDASTEPRSHAGLIKAGLEQEVFVWRPKNPAYNTVAPLLKDGVTANPDFDNTGNPELADGSGKANRVGDVCKHFDVNITVNP